MRVCDRAITMGARKGGNWERDNCPWGDIGILTRVRGGSEEGDGIREKGGNPEAKNRGVLIPITIFCQYGVFISNHEPY